MFTTTTTGDIHAGMPILDGAVITPDDARYDDARAVFTRVYDDHPTVVVRPAHARDVAAVVRYAADTGIDLAVRGGGHGAAGHGSVDGGIVLDLRDLTGLQIDAADRSAWAGTGMSAGAYTAAVGTHGLATGFGDNGAVGIGGITLVGGVGFLTRKLGLTVDSVLAAEVVTADGAIVVTDHERHPDLFWAIRGGGGNFGVVTQFRYRLHPVDQVVGGSITFEATPAAVAGLVEIADAASDDLGIIATVSGSDGRLVIGARVVHTGSPEEADRDLAALRALADPISEDIRPRPYPEMVPPVDPGWRSGVLSTARATYLDTLDLDAATAIVDHLGDWDATSKSAQIRVLGGAASRLPGDSTAYAHRTRRVVVNVSAAYPEPDDRAARQAQIDALVGAVDHGDGAAYAAFLGREGHDRVRAAYPGATWDRLTTVKRRYDPENVFHVNQNIPPAMS